MSEPSSEFRAAFDAGAAWATAGTSRPEREQAVREAWGQARQCNCDGAEAEGHDAYCPVSAFDPEAGSEQITLSLDGLWSSILVGISGEHDEVPTTTQINRTVRLMKRAAAREAS